jgi:hypothetical protein
LFFILQDDLPNLKCFSLTCYRSSDRYDNVIVPFLRRMTHIEELTLYIHILGKYPFISGIDIDNEVLAYMPRLQTFSFYVACETDIINDIDFRQSAIDVEKTFKNILYRQVTCVVDYFMAEYILCRIFSLPFKFSRLKNLGNYFPNVIFNNVTHLSLWDERAFKHEFFLRLSQSFLSLQYLSIWNIRPPTFEFTLFNLHDEDWRSTVQFLHLKSLDIEDACIYYTEHFLNETKTSLPCLTELKISYRDLKAITNNFTRDETRRNCAKIERLFIPHHLVDQNDICHYFPLLSY